MEIGAKQLAYLMAVYTLNQQPEAVGTAEIARMMGCSKASVSNMMTTLMNRGLLVKERYGKVYLTDTGYLLARDTHQCMEELQRRLPLLDLALTPDQNCEAALALLSVLPESALEQLHQAGENAR